MLGMIVDEGSQGTLAGNLVFLRRVTGADAALVVRWRNDPDIAAKFFSAAAVTAEGHRAWCERNQGSVSDFTFIIHERQSGDPVGMVAIYNVDRERGEAEFGRLLIGEREHRGRGFAKDAVRTALTFAFVELGLSEVYLRVWGDNHPATSLYRALGFADGPMEIDAETGRQISPMRLVRARFRGAA